MWSKWDTAQEAWEQKNRSTIFPGAPCEITTVSWHPFIQQNNRLHQQTAWQSCYQAYSTTLAQRLYTLIPKPSSEVLSLLATMCKYITLLHNKPAANWKYSKQSEEILTEEQLHTPHQMQFCFLLPANPLQHCWFPQQSQILKHSTDVTRQGIYIRYQIHQQITVNQAGIVCVPRQLFFTCPLNLLQPQI